MVLWVGIDDTDSLRGMCTTYLATEVVRELSAERDVIGYPRLVRLNPNVPWKTRGNGALALRFGRGIGRPRVVGCIGGRDVLSYPEARGREDPEGLRRPLEELIRRWSVWDDPTTNPGFAVLRRPPSASLYWRAVRGIVSRTQARRAAAGLGLLRGFKNGRGIIGATAAVAWRPRDRTYEVLAYRDPALWGLRREVDARSVREMDKAFPSTFNNYDYENDRVVLAPHSPCPVLLGVRGDSPEDLPKALDRIRGERPERWLLFETNQGTDDHIAWDDWSLRPHTATSLKGTVSKMPWTRSGGHVLVRIRGRAEVDVAAYEPSGSFRDTVRALRPGDTVRAWASVRDEPRTLNLEKLQVLGLVEDVRKVANPACPSCGKSMKSMGQGAGFRCIRDRTRAPLWAADRRVAPRAVSLGLYEPPANARRHLSKPIQRMVSNRTERAGPADVAGILRPPLAAVTAR